MSAVTKTKETQSKTKVVAKGLLAGSMAGVFQTVSGHPLDTIKLKMQAAEGAVSVRSVISSTMKNEGVTGLFRGMLSPIAGAGVQNIFIIGSNQISRQFVCKDPLDPTITEAFVAGLFIAPSLALPLAPIDLIKCRLQVQSSLNPTIKFNGPYEMVKHIYRSHGVKGLFQGYGACCVRELFIAFYFAANIATKKALTNGRQDKKLGIFDMLLAGGAAGAAFWTTSYPFDMIKSRIQITDISKTGGKHAGVMGTFKQIVQKEGVTGLYRGFTPCLARAFIVNAFVFLGYDATILLLNSLDS